MDRRRFVLLVTLAGVLSGWSSARGGEKLRRLRWSLTIENPTAELLSDQKVWIYVPLESGSAQRLVSFDVSTEHGRQIDQIGNCIVQMDFPSVPAFSTRVVTFDALLDMAARSTAELLNNGNPWLTSENYIESDSPDIRALSGQLRGESVAETVKSIYDWVKQNIRYAGFIADDLGAAYALRERRGDCTEYAYLTVALARAAGVPARAVGGYVLEQDSTLRASDYHNWAEVYVDGAWLLVDPQKGCFNASYERYVVFRRISSRVLNPLGAAHRYTIQGRVIVRFG